MKFKMQLHEALSNLLVSKLRSFLALLGVLVGTASVVAMVSGGNLATQAALQELTRLGTNLLSVSIYSQNNNQQSAANTPKPMSYQAVMATPSKVHGVTLVGPYSQIYSQMSFHGQVLSGGIVGVTQDLQKIVGIRLKEGRFISDLDGYSMKCVIGNSLYKSIRQHTGEDLLNTQIQVGSQFCTVVGVMDQWQPNSFMYTDLNYSLLMPLKASMVISKYATISDIVFRLQKNLNIAQVKATVQEYIKLHTSNMSLFFMSPQQLIDSAKKQSDILTLFLAFIGSISLLVGGIGVMNIMLVSVVERKREIGIRKAVGARSKDIVSLFLIESVLLSLTGGVLGVVLGVITTYIIALFKGWHFTIFIMPITAGFCVSVLCGVFFGIYPAYKASRLDPIEALHSA